MFLNLFIIADVYLHTKKNEDMFYVILETVNKLYGIQIKTKQKLYISKGICEIRSTRFMDVYILNFFIIRYPCEIIPHFIIYGDITRCNFIIFTRFILITFLYRITKPGECRTFFVTSFYRQFRRKLSMDKQYRS